MRSMFLRHTVAPFRLLEKIWNDWEEAYKAVIQEMKDEEEDRRYNRDEKR